MKIGRFTIWTRTVPPSDAASVLSRHGAQLRRASVKERAREIRRELGLPADKRLA